MADPRYDLELNLRSWGVGTEKSQDARSGRGGLRGWGWGGQSFNILVSEILHHDLTLVSRCAIIKKLVTTYASARSDSCKQGWPQQAQTFCSISQWCSSPLQVVFAARFRFELKNIVYSTFFWDRFLLAIWGGFLPFGTHALSGVFLPSS